MGRIRLDQRSSACSAPLDGFQRSPPILGRNGMSDKRTKTNSERIHRPDERDRSSRVAPRARAVERVAGIAFPQFLRTFTLAFGVIAGAAAPSLAPAADQTPAAFISTIGNDALAEMRSSVLGSEIGLFRSNVEPGFRSGWDVSFCSWPPLAHRKPGAAAIVPISPGKTHHALPR